MSMVVVLWLQSTAYVDSCCISSYGAVRDVDGCCVVATAADAGL